MPTLAQVRNVVDARLADLWTNQILPKQAVYLAAHGRYWQGIRTTVLTLLPNNLTADATTAEVTPDTSGHPTDQAETWADANINLGATIPMALEIHAYDGPLGKGFVGMVWARVNGTTYTRAQQSGPETWRTQAWQVAT